MQGLLIVATAVMQAHSRRTDAQQQSLQLLHHLLHLQATFYEAVCKQIDPVKKEIICAFPNASTEGESFSFKLPYDILVMGVS